MGNLEQAAEKKPLIVLTGPTAVGKTALSIQLARRIGGEIISADSMQVYRHMDIGTAKIRLEEMDGVPHHLIDILEPTEDFNVVRFQALARAAAEDIYSRGKIPIVAGGTGFYIQALLNDIDFTQIDENTQFREEMERLLRAVEKEMEHKDGGWAVEDIQDAVERVLMENGRYEEAKRYILYRHRRNEQRAARRAMAQAAGVPALDGVLAKIEKDFPGEAYALTVLNAKFQSFVKPGMGADAALEALGIRLRTWTRIPSKPF